MAGPAKDQAASGTALPVQPVKLDDAWRLGFSFTCSPCYGVFRTAAELERVWASMVNAWDEHRGFRGPRERNQPIMPTIDFERSSVLWYADFAGSASWTTLQDVVEYPDALQADVTLFHSDFGSRHLNLWTIPKTAKPVRFVEQHEYESRVGSPGP